MPDDRDAQVIPMPGVDLMEWQPPAAELVPTEPLEGEVVPVDVSIIDTRIIATRGQAWAWVVDCWWGARLTGRRATIHTVRAPLYYARAVRYAPRGVWVAGCAWWRWVRDHESIWLRQDVANDHSIVSNIRAKRVEELHDARKARVRARWVVTLTAANTALVGWWWAWGHDRTLWTGATLLALLVLGLVGAARGQVIQQVHTPTEVALTVDQIMRAYTEAKITKPDEPVTVIGVPHRVNSGWYAEVELPGGVTYDTVVKNRVELASGLNCPRDCLSLDDLPTKSERLMALHVSDVHPLDAQIPPWPLLDVDRWDIWRPIPIGWDAQGRLVVVMLMWLHTLIGAAPQRGKSTLMRLLALATLLDPRADLILANFKGGRDWSAFEPYATRYINGSSPAEVEEFVALLGWLEVERQRRMKVIEKAGQKAPEGRLTQAMAEDPALGMRPLVVIVDEMQVITEDKALRKRGVIDAWSQLLKLCPAAGICIVSATQNPSANSVPTDLGRIYLQRIALSVQSRQGSEAVLGSAAYQEGLDASKLGGRPGLAIMWAQAHEDGPGFRGRLRVPNCTPADADVMLQRVARVRAAVRSQPVERTVPQVVADVLAAWPHPEVAAHVETLAAATGQDKTTLSAELRALGLAARQVKVAGVNRRGYYLADVERLAR